MHEFSSLKSEHNSKVKGVIENELCQAKEVKDDVQIATGLAINIMILLDTLGSCCQKKV